MYFIKGQTPESGIPHSDRATRRYTKVHLDFCLRFSTLIGQIGRVPLFGAGPRWYIRSRLFRLAVIAFWRALTLPGGKKASESRFFLGPFARLNCLRILRPLHFGTTRSKYYKSLRHTQPWQPTSLSKLPTHTARGCHTHARTFNARQRDKSPDSPATPSRTGGEINVVLQQQQIVRV